MLKYHRHKFCMGYVRNAYPNNPIDYSFFVKSYYYPSAPNNFLLLGNSMVYYRAHNDLPLGLVWGQINPLCFLMCYLNIQLLCLDLATGEGKK
jgi:hypothetical protein